MRLAGLHRSSLLVSALLIWQAEGRGSEVEHLRYERAILTGGAGPSCAVLDAAVLSHAAESLKDVRVVSGGRELAYAIAVNETAQVESDAATVMNLKEDAAGAAFDLAMPARAYTQLVFQLDGKDFVAEAELAGLDELPSVRPVPLGTFTLFDMSRRKLSRSTRVSLQESRFPFLHVVLRGRGFRLKGVEVPPSREGQTLFTTVAETSVLKVRGSELVATIRLPARVPVERIAVRLDSKFKGNFSRTVRVSAVADAPRGVEERVTGKVMRVRRGVISVDDEAFGASLGANLQSDATVEVAIENEGEAVLPVVSVALSMRQRALCLEADGPAALYYGDQAAGPTHLRYEPPARWRLARLGPEVLNRGFRERGEPPVRRWWSRGLVWMGGLGLLLGVGVLWCMTRRLWRRGV